MIASFVSIMLVYNVIQLAMNGRFSQEEEVEVSSLVGGFLSASTSQERDGIL